MKKRAAAIAAIIIGLAAIIASAIMAINIYNKDSSDDEKTHSVDAPTAKIESFHYNYGSYFGGYYYYTIEEDDGAMMINGSGANGVDLNINKEISDEKLEELRKIILDNKIYEWDGFDEDNNGILDGYSFTLKVKYTDGREIVARGYEKYPGNYDESHAKLAKFMESLE